jgi:tripartite-type tricarboxylate transporter receptor subunit TctC
MIRQRCTEASARCAALAALAAVCASPAYAQSWPVKPVRVIVPFVPGGTADTLGRITAARLADNLGQSFVIDNRAGAGGVIGTELLARSAPDGYTLGVSGFGSHVRRDGPHEETPCTTRCATSPTSPSSAVPPRCWRFIHRCRHGT